MKVSSRVLHLIVMGKPEDALAVKAPQLFDALRTPEGKKNAKYWFKKHALHKVLSAPAPSFALWSPALVSLLMTLTYCMPRYCAAV